MRRRGFSPGPRDRASRPGRSPCDGVPGGENAAGWAAAGTCPGECPENKRPAGVPCATPTRRGRFQWS
eukprot:7697906-Alexandrium_andersonii.AAC.1